MTGGAWPAADERLVRRYRRLLLAYSGGYRRRHGTEMVTTMLEMAEPGRSRPSAGEAWHLIASGVRQRFHLPSGRPLAWVAAVLATLVLGVFGAAAGSWLGQRTFADLPSRAGALTLVEAAVKDPRPGAVFIHRLSRPGRADSLSVAVLPRAPERDGPPAWTVEEARAGLTAAGWTITEFTIHPRPASVTCAQDEKAAETCSLVSRDATLTAERDGLVLNGTATDFLANDSGDVFDGGVRGDLYAARGAAYLPLTAAGGLLGAVAGWLLTAAFAYRIRSRPAGSARSAAALAGVALALSAPPVWAVLVDAVMVGEHLTGVGPAYVLHAALRPGSNPGGAGAWFMPGCALAAAAAAITAGILVRGADRKESSDAAQPT